MASLFFVHLVPVSAVPVNNTPEYAPSWVAEPDQRGTWSLLYSCLFTLGLCVWSAIHLNIPRRGEPQSYQLWRKVKWVFIAIVAPELVLLSAWQQFYQARQLCAELNKLKHGNEEEVQTLKAWTKRIAKDVIRLKLVKASYAYLKGQAASLTDNVRHLNYLRPSWWVRLKVRREKEKAEKEAWMRSRFSLTYGYYVVMGGLVVNVQDIYDDVEFLTLTPQGALEIATKTGYATIEVPDEVTRDKSKADNLGKVLLIFQVGWAVLQTLARWVLHYPLTILEVHILVHAICALMMYTIWIPKPFDIRESTLLDSSKFDDELALQLIRSPGTMGEKTFTNLVTPVTLIGAPRRWRKLKPRGCSEAMFLMFDASQSDTAIHHDTELIRIIDDRILPASSSAAENPDGPFSTTNKYGLLYRPGNRVASILNLETGMKLKNGIGPGAIFGEVLPHKNIMPIEAELTQLLTMSDPDPRPEDDRQLFRISVALSVKDVCRWERAGRALQREVTPKLRTPSISTPDQPKLSRVGKTLSGNIGASNGPRLTVRASNFDWMLWESVTGNEDESFGLATMYALAVVSSSYAAIHLALWNYDFPTRVEMFLWKIAACTLAVPGGFILSMVALAVGVAPVLVALFAFEEIRSRFIWKVVLDESAASKKRVRDRETTNQRYGEIEAGLRARTETTSLQSATNLQGSNSESQGQDGVVAVNDGRQPSQEADKISLSGNRETLQTAPDETQQRQREIISPLPGDRSEGEDSRVAPAVQPIDLPVQSEVQRTLTQPEDTENHPKSTLPNQRKKRSGWKDMSRTKRTLLILTSPLTGALVLAAFGLGLAELAAAALYVLSRVYIVVESFISLRKVPVGVYEDISWARYIPHL